MPLNCYDGRAAEERDHHPVVGGLYSTRINLTNSPFAQAAAQQTGFCFEKGLPVGGVGLHALHNMRGVMQDVINSMVLSTDSLTQE